MKKLFPAILLLLIGCGGLKSPDQQDESKKSQVEQSTTSSQSEPAQVPEPVVQADSSAPSNPADVPPFVPMEIQVLKQELSYYKNCENLPQGLVWQVNYWTSGERGDERYVFVRILTESENNIYRLPPIPAGFLGLSRVGRYNMSLVNKLVEPARCDFEETIAQEYLEGRNEDPGCVV